MISIILLVLLAVFGAVLRRRDIVSEAVKQRIFQYVYYVATPVAVVHALTTHQLEGYSRYGIFLLVNSAVYLGVFFAAHIYMTKRKVKHVVAGVIAFSATAPNSVFIGFPLVLALFHQEAFIFAVLLGTLMDAVLNFIRISVIHSHSKRASKIHSSHAVLLARSILNPFLVSLLIGFALVYFKVVLPDFIAVGIKYIGKSASYAALFVLGLSVGKLKISKKDYEEIAVVSGLKLFVLPALVFVASKLLGLSQPAVYAGVFIAALPPAVFSLVVAANLKLDERLAASSILVATCTSLLTLPFWYIILTNF